MLDSSFYVFTIVIQIFIIKNLPENFLAAAAAAAAKCMRTFIHKHQNSLESKAKQSKEYVTLLPHNNVCVYVLCESVSIPKHTHTHVHIFFGEHRSIGLR